MASMENEKLRACIDALLFMCAYVDALSSVGLSYCSKIQSCHFVLALLHKLTSVLNTIKLKLDCYSRKLLDILITVSSAW